MSWPRGDEPTHETEEQADWRERAELELASPLYSPWAGPLAEEREKRVVAAIFDVIRGIRDYGTIHVAREIADRLKEPL